MTPEERKEYLKQPFDAVVIRSFKTKTSDKEPVKEFKVGANISITHEFGDEALSLGKIVKKDSPQHKAWIVSEAKKEASRKQLGEAGPTTNELIHSLLEKIDTLTEAVSEVLSGKKGK